jgi:glycerol-3-phosphate O-acyltransferase
MFQMVELPLWLLILILAFAAVTALSHLFFPSVRWFLRRRAERVVARLNTVLERPIQPFKLARRTDMIQRVIYDRDVVEAVQKHAAETGVREDVAFEEARRYAREIVPSFSASAYFGFATRAAKRLSRFLFDVHFAEARPGSLEEIDSEATIVYVMNHRSNMDYVLVTYLAAPRAALSYAVGEWARIWPLQGLIKSMGAFFIRRRSRNQLYRRVLARYVQLSVQAGVTQAMFPEGGLSLTGGVGDPKLGLLSYIVDGYDPEGRDVVFVPVALNYDRVLEDRVLIAAERRGDRRFRGSVVEATLFTFRYLLRRMRGVGHRFGTAAVVAAEPISLHAISTVSGTPSPEDLGDALISRIRENIPVPVAPLIARAVLEDAARSEADIVASVKRMTEILGGEGIFLGFDEADTEISVVNELAVMRRRGILTNSDPASPVGDGSDLLEFYANSVAMHFTETAINAPHHRTPQEFEPT